MLSKKIQKAEMEEEEDGEERMEDDEKDEENLRNGDDRDRGKNENQCR